MIRKFIKSLLHSYVKGDEVMIKTLTKYNFINPITNKPYSKYIIVKNKGVILKKLSNSLFSNYKILMPNKSTIIVNKFALKFLRNLHNDN